MFHQDRFDFRRSQPLACHLDRVVRAAEDVPQPVVVDGSPVAMDPDAGKAGPVRLLVAFRVAPESTRHANPWRTHHELTNVIPHRLTLLVDDVCRNAWWRPCKRRRLEWRHDVASHQSARDFGATRVIDDRQTAAAGDVEQPAPRFRIPWFAGRAE